MTNKIQTSTLVIAAWMGIDSAFASETSLDVVSTMKYHGVCDGSAAIRIDQQTLLVAYDEKNILYAFDIWGGFPVAERDIGSLLTLRDGSNEMDLEGAAVLDNKIWWIGSHGLDGDGNDAENRRVLFSTNIPSRDLVDLKVLSQPIDVLEVIGQHWISASLLSDEVSQRKPKEGGINIEGLTTSPLGELVIGFRSPLSGEDGLTGAATVVNLSAETNGWGVSSVSRLDLTDKGIRDIVAYNSGYLLLAGNVGPQPGTEVYWWDGSSNIKTVSSTGIASLNPESILRVNDQWLMLSDDGKKKRIDEEASDGDRKCDKIRKKNSRGAQHHSVYFRGVTLNERP